MHERQVVVVLPFGRLGLQALRQKRFGLIGTSWSAWKRLAQKNGAEPIGNREVRVERGREIEERIQQCVVPRPVLDEPLTAVDLKRPDPIHVGRQRVELHDHPIHRGTGPHIQDVIGVGEPTRELAIAEYLDHHRGCKDRALRRPR